MGEHVEITAEHAGRILESFGNKNLRIVVDDCSAECGPEGAPVIIVECAPGTDFGVACALSFAPALLRSVLALTKQRDAAIEEARRAKELLERAVVASEKAVHLVGEVSRG